MKENERAIMNFTTIFGKGSIKTNAKKGLLATSSEVEPNIELRWGEWNEETKKWDAKGKIYNNMDDFKEIVITICPGDVVSMSFETWDGTKLPLPLSSLNIEIAEAPGFEELKPKE